MRRDYGYSTDEALWEVPALHVMVLIRSWASLKEFEGLRL